MQVAFFGDSVNANGDIVRTFHADRTGVVNPATATVLTGTSGTVLARLGNDPLILVTTFGQGRAVHFGTLDYLRADRFGFLMGLDDLFWRSLVWAARKPFVIRGYPRLWAVQLDDTEPGWGFRVRDLYDPALTGQVSADGTGGPWKVTGYLYVNNLPPGSAERASVVADIRAGKLQVTPHTFDGVTYGDMYWNQAAGPLTDQQWLTNLNAIQQWKQGLGGNDAIPRFSRSLVAHFWDLSNNTGFDLWNTLGFRYITSIQKPGFQNFTDVTINNGAERLNARPFRLYDLPPKTVRDEDYSMFFADDYVVGSRSGLPPQTFFLFLSQLQDYPFYPRADAIWPSSSFSLTEALEQWQRYTWRFWSSLAPVQIYTHDAVNLAQSSVAERQAFISQLSAFLNQNGVRHVFMEELGDYIRARTKSRLVDVRLVGSDLVYTFTGTAATADNTPVATEVLVTFDNSSEGVFDTLPGFTSNGATITQPLPPPPPAVVGISPASGPVAGGTTVTITGTGFVNVTAVTIGGRPTSFAVASSTSLTAVTPPGTTGPADVGVTTGSGTATLLSGFTYLGPPVVSKIEPNFGPSAGGTTVTISGAGFDSATTVFVAGRPASNVVVTDAATLTAVTPPGSSGAADVAVTNSFGTTNVTAGFLYFSGDDVIRLNFTYSSREEFIASGWDFLARTSAGGVRDTEQHTGLTVSFDQSAHPGVVRIPADAGDLYQGLNNSRNTLFFSLPDGWRSVRMKIRSFAPNADFQQAALVVYQDDDNYVAVSRYFNSGVPGNQLVEFASETAGTYTVISRSAAPAGSTLYLRLDRSTSNNSFQAFISPDGQNWTQLSGSTASTLTQPRVAVVVGANDSTTSFPNADIEWVEMVVVQPPPALQIVPGQLSFSGVAGAPSPSPKTVQIGNTGGGVLSWSVTENATWISVSPSSGTAGPTSPATITVSVNSSALDPGTYSTVMTISASGAIGSPQTIPVTLTLSPPAPPTVTDVAPSFGPAAGGTSVTVTGTGFVTGTTVSFNGVPASNLTLLSATQLTATTPPGSAGPANVTVSNANGSATLAGGFTYVVPGTVLLSDDFNDGTLDGWTPSPLGNAAGWSITSGALTYNGGGHTQLFRGDPAWTDYTLEVSFRLSSLNNFPGGLRGRLDPTTGAGYAVWLYPATGQITLFRTTGWNIDSPGLTQLATASGIAFDTTSFHRLRLTFQGTSIQVHYDGALVISASDTTHPTGLVALDVSNQPIAFDNVSVLFGAPPTVIGVSPTFGPAAGGTSVTVTGTGFVTGTTVSFNGVPASNLTLLSATQLTATTPPGSAGPANVTVSNANGSATLAGGFTYVVPGTVLLSDDFNDGTLDGWTPSPLGNAAGWSITSGALTYNGGGHTQLFRGDPAWTDYTLEVSFRLSSLNNFPGGLRGRLDPTTGAGYAVWLYPATGQITLFRTTGWNIDSPGLTQLATASGIAFDTTSFHRLRLTFQGTSIQVHYDGALVISASDTTHPTGLVALDVSNQPVTFDDTLVTFAP